MSHHRHYWDLTPGQRMIMEKIFKQPKATGVLLKDVQRRITGEFPQGRLNASDEGAIALNIGHENGKVKIIFPKPVNWIGFTPEEAVTIAESLIKHARACATQPLSININL